MIRSLRLLLLSLSFALFVGCASNGSLTNPFADDSPPPATPYYYDEFPDIPIPNEMSEVKNDTVISSTSSGTRVGIELFRGRVDSVSLINAMRRNMMSQGWTLRSLFRAKQTILVYEKSDRITTLYITDGLVYADLRVFVSPVLHGDSVDMDVTTTLVPEATPETNTSKPLSAE